MNTHLDLPRQRPRKFIFLPIFLSALLVGATMVTLWPESAEARVGKGSSVGSRGSRSFAAPEPAMPRSTTQPQPANPGFQTAPHPSAPAPAPASGWGRGLMAGIGGFMLGGLVGSLLFGHGMGGAGSGILDLLLMAGLLWFAIRWFRNRRQEEQPQAAGPYATSREAMSPNEPFPAGGGGGAFPNRFTVANDTDDLSRGLQHIAAMDPHFNLEYFLQGAKMAFQELQNGWSNWRPERLQPLLTDRMWTIIQAQAKELHERQVRNMVERIQFESADISEAWQEAGSDWLTVCFQISMVDFTTDLQGKVLDGDPQTPIRFTEFWTFTRAVGSPDPNWQLAAIQQPGEVAKSSY